MPNWLSLTFAFLFGAAVGSFVNVCIYRLPRRLSLVRPPSHCPFCGAYLTAFDLVPLLSYLWLGAKCRHCKTPISPRYFFVELLSGFMFVGAVERYGVTGDGVLVAVSLAALIVIALVDWEFFLVPDEAVWALGVFGFLRQIFGYGIPGAVTSLAGALFSGLLIWLVGILGRWLFRKEAMGFGDVKIAAAVGAHLRLSWLLLPFFLFSVFLGALMGVLLALWHRKTLTGYIPFGPAMAIAAGIVFLAPDSVIQFVLRLYGVTL